MRSNPFSEMVAVNGAMAFTALCLYGPNRDRILQAEGHQAIAEALMAHSHSLGMNQHGCIALVEIGGHAHDSMDKVAHEKGCSGIVESARAHLEALTLLLPPAALCTTGPACVTLVTRNPSFFSFNRQAKEVQLHSWWALVHLGGNYQEKDHDVKAIPEAMRVHRWNGDVQQHGAWTIRYHYAMGQYLERIMDEGAAGCLVKGLTHTPYQCS